MDNRRSGRTGRPLLFLIGGAIAPRGPASRGSSESRRTMSIGCASPSLTSGVKVDIRTRRGLYVYRITGSEVTDPSDRTILVPTQDHRLVLTTCYPLWAGAFARQRLIYFATETGPGRRPA